jgi:hypothetical protein
VRAAATTLQILVLSTCGLKPAVGQDVSHGTYFLAGFSAEYVVVAIDSRELNGTQVNDRYCKIRPLSPNAFFFATGSTSATNKTIRMKISLTLAMLLPLPMANPHRRFRGFPI